MEHAARFVYARDAVPVVHLHDVPNRVREVALHGVHHGAAMALPSTQAHSGHELRLLPHGFLAAVHSKDYECLIEDFFSASNFVALISQADDIVAKVYSGP